MLPRWLPRFGFGAASFERPYGWVWSLRLQAELKSWDDPDAKKWAAHLTPLTDLVVERRRKFFGTDFGCAPNVELSGATYVDYLISQPGGRSAVSL